jgi:PAS domain S-box-containing protein
MWGSWTRWDRVVCVLGIALTAAGFAGVWATPADAPQRLQFWDFLHWTASFSAAAILACMGAWKAPAAVRSARRWFAVGFLGQFVGILWDIQVFINWSGFPSPSDVFYLILGIGCLMGLWSTLRQSLPRSEWQLARLDLATLSTAAIAFTLALYLPRRGGTPALQLIFLTAYPAILLTAAAAGALFVLHLRPRLSGAWVFFLGFLVVEGALWMEWNARTLDLGLRGGALLNIAFSVTVLGMGLGARDWAWTTSDSPRYRMACEALRRFLPLLAVVMAAAAVVLVAFLPDIPSAARGPIGVGAAAVVVLAMVRQSFIVREVWQAKVEAERTRDELHIQHTWLKEIFAHFPGGVSVMDKDLRVVEHNREYYSLLGLPAQLFEGEPPSLETIIRYNAEHGEYGEVDVDAYVAGTMERARRFEAHHFERIRPDGRVLEVRGRPLPGGGFVSSHTDITERKRADEKLRHSEEKFARIVHASPDAIGIARVSDGMYVEANPAFEQVIGYLPSEVIGRTTAELGIWTYPEQSRDLVRLYRSRGEVSSHEIVLRAKDGRLVTGLISVRGMMIEEEEHFLFFLRDITERKQLEEEARARAAAELASRAKSEFLSRMSHELRTPLNAILGFSQVLEHDSRNRLAPQQLVQVQHIQRGGWHLLDMINDVLDLTKIEAGKLTVSIQSVRVSQVVADSLPLAAAAAEAAQVRIEHDAAAGADLWVQADGLRLRQVLVNLLSNGAKYNRPGGRVSVSCTHGDGRVALRVADTGIGLTADQIADLFQPFNRVGAEQTEVEGTGLGLMITKNLVEYMHGTIEVESTPGVGTVFTVSLPQGEPAAPKRPAAAGRVRGRAKARGRVVLYVEDNLSNALVVEAILASRPDLRLELAADGPAGLEAARQVKPDLILLDIDLPGLSGLQVLERLRADPATAAIPCVALSANAMPEDIAAALAAGFLDYWTKPVDVQTFLRDVDAVLAGELLAERAAAVSAV